MSSICLALTSETWLASLYKFSGTQEFSDTYEGVGKIHHDFSPRIWLAKECGSGTHREKDTNSRKNDIFRGHYVGNTMGLSHLHLSCWPLQVLSSQLPSSSTYISQRSAICLYDRPYYYLVSNPFPFSRALPFNCLNLCSRYPIPLVVLPLVQIFAPYMVSIFMVRKTVVST